MAGQSAFRLQDVRLFEVAFREKLPFGLQFLMQRGDNFGFGLYLIRVSRDLRVHLGRLGFQQGNLPPQGFSPGLEDFLLVVQHVLAAGQRGHAPQILRPGQRFPQGLFSGGAYLRGGLGHQLLLKHARGGVHLHRFQNDKGLAFFDFFSFPAPD